MDATRPILFAAVTAGVFASAPFASAMVIFNDTFDVPAGAATRGDDPADPLDIAFTAERGGASVLDDSAGLGTGFALEVSDPAGGYGFIRTLGNFAPQNLAVGEQLVLSGDFRAINDFADNTSALRIGLGNGVDKTYGLTIGSVAGSGALLRYPNSSASGSGSTNLGATKIGDFVFDDDAVTGQNANSFSFVVSRDASGLNLNATLNGVNTLSAEDNSTDASFAFSGLSLGTGSVDTDFRFDNLRLESSLVPEPASALLLFAGGCALASRRRTREMGGGGCGWDAAG